MVRPGFALDRAALRAAVVAGARGGWWTADPAVDLRRGLGHRYRRLYRRAPDWRPAIGAAMEPAQDLGRRDRRRRLCGAGGLGDRPPARRVGATFGFAERGTCDCRAVRRSCGVR